MDAETYARLGRLYAVLLEQPPEHRRSFLRDQCADEPELLDKLEGMLRQAEVGDEDFASGPRLELLRGRVAALLSNHEPASPQLSDPTLPETLGRYRVIRRIASGGMGTVFEAEQSDPCRRVAIKVLHGASLNPGLRLRFQREAEILGRLQHRYIAQIFEASVMDVGRGERPFYVMEFIEGQTITKHADTRDLSARDRLELLARVCEGVDYAHEKHVIHRDLKPDNILIDAHGDPKVLDFGVASIGNEAAVSVTTVTHTGQVLGTLAYMAPEVLTGRGNLADPRIDVYALGVIGYELLSGRRPLEPASPSMAAAIRALEFDTIVRLGAIDRTWKGDIDTIIGKAIERDPRRRYASARAMGADIRRHLAARPILARRPSRAYRLSTFVRRNRVLVGGVAATFLALLLGLIVSLHFGFRADSQRQLAEMRERESARNETIAARGLLLAAQRFKESGREWDALEQLQLIPHSRRQWEWRHIARGLPLVIDTAPPEAFVRWIDDHRFLTPDVRLRNGEPSRGFRLYDIREPDRYELIFQDLPVHGLDKGGPGPRFLVNTSGTSMALIDVDARQVLDEWSVPTVGQLWIGPREKEYLIRVGSSTVHAYRRDEKLFDFSIRPVWPSFAFHPQEPFVVTDNQVGQTWNVDTRTGEILNTANLSNGRITNVAMHPSGEFFAIAAPGDGICLRDPRTFEELRRMGPQPGGIVLTFSPDGSRLLASSNSDHTLRLWDVASGALLWSQDHGRTGEAHSVSFSADGTWVTDRQRNDNLPTMFNLDPRTWDSPGFVELRGHTSWIYPIALSNDGHLLLSGAPMDPHMRLWDVISGRELARIPWSTRSLANNMGACMAFAADDTEILVTGTAPTGELAMLRCDLATGAQVWTPIKGDYWTSIDVIRQALGPAFHGRLNEYVLIRRNGDMIKSSPWDGRHEMYVDFASGEQRQLTTSHWNRGAVAVDPQDQTMVFASLRRLFATTTYGVEEEWLFEGRAEGVHGLDFSPDGARLALGIDDGRIAILDTRFMLKVCEWQAHPENGSYNYVWAVRWTPDGKRLISASGDGTIRIWESEREFQRIEAREAWEGLRSTLRAREQEGTLDEAGLSPLEAAALRSVRIEAWGRTPQNPTAPDAAPSLPGESIATDAQVSASRS